jgi:hypothetical protein
MLALLESPVTQATPHTILPKGLAEKLEGVRTDAATIATNHHEITGIHGDPRKDEAVKRGAPLTGHIVPGTATTVRRKLPPNGNPKRPLQMNVHRHARPETEAQLRLNQP